MVSNRSHLSIGDVLTLLREEFPDVTISKIRFLESQGLVNPERSPSGYRKFYEHDVERLRWVLRQQREHFLPLKVIRDRLVESGGELPPDEAVEPAAGGDAGLDDIGSGQPAPEPEPALVLAHAPGGQGTDAVGGAGVRGVRSRPAGAPGTRSDAAGPAPLRRLPDDPLPGLSVPSTASGPPGVEHVRDLEHIRDSENGGEPPSPAATAWSTPARAPGGPSRPPDPEEDPGPDPGPGETPGGVGAARAGRAGSGQGPLHRRDEPAGRDAEDQTPPFSPTDGVSGASLTIEELCAATGLGAAAVASLEALGLVDSTSVAGVACYDESALAVASLVSQFGRYGIEPRHLRLYRNAAEREAGLVEQIVTPLLRQRNPEARRRAVDSATDLAALGQRLRAALLRKELRRLLG
jgi:DNA-binding transcriptional MerR regulator